MQVTVNGESRRLDQPATVADLLAACNLAKAACAVEVNRELVPKRRHAERQLQEGDRVEIVSLVGGG